VQVKIQFEAVVSLRELRDFLMGKQSGKMVQRAVQALDIVVRQIPSYQFTPVGRSFFALDGHPVGEGCEVKFGFRQSIRHSEWKAMLVNIDGEILIFHLTSLSLVAYMFEQRDDNIIVMIARGKTPLHDCHRSPKEGHHAS